MDRLVQEVRASGGRIVTQEFQDAASVLTLEEDVVFNCTGIGARALFGDKELIPIKGQWTILKPQPEVDYIAGPIPREDGSLIIFHRQIAPTPNPIASTAPSQRGSQG